MSNPVLDFLSADTHQRLELLGDPETANAVRRFVGDAAFADLDKLRHHGLAQPHLGIKSPPNLVFVPGVMGSLLQSDTKGGVWWLNVDTRKEMNGLALSPDGLTDADQNNQISPFNVDFTYEPFASAVLACDDFGYRKFAYDWRKMYSQSTQALRDLILKMHEDNGKKPVHVVAHSMGGLMVRATLKRFGNDLWDVLGRIVFIGTPHYGSPSIAGYLKNHLWGWEKLAILGLYLSRDTFRSLWGVLSLLPAPAGVYPGTTPRDNPKWQPPSDSRNFYVHPCANFDLYDANAWNLELSPAATANLQTILDGVTAFHREMYAWHTNAGELLQQNCDRMLMIAGVGYKCLFRLEYKDRLGGLWTSMNKVTDRVPGDPNRDGDGRVPLASAKLTRVAMRYTRGLHGGLTNIPAVYNEVFRWLRNQPLQLLPDNPSDALGGHLSAASANSISPHLDGSARTRDDDPGYLDVDAPPLANRAAIDAELASGAMPDFNSLKIL